MGFHEIGCLMKPDCGSQKTHTSASLRMLRKFIPTLLQESDRLREKIAYERSRRNIQLYEILNVGY